MYCQKHRLREQKIQHVNLGIISNNICGHDLTPLSSIKYLSSHILRSNNIKRDTCKNGWTVGSRHDLRQYN
jgi:hypothetical protein